MPPTDMPRTDKIVDISHHQERPIDFGKLKDAGIIAVIHKATQGTHFKDPLYTQRRKDAEKHDMLWGAYHFSEDESDGGSGSQQAKFFLDFIGNVEGIFYRWIMRPTIIGTAQKLITT